MKKIVLVTGGFDPLHSGHITYLNYAQHHSNDLHLIVGLNSDAWLDRKKGRAFMTWRERMTILDNLHMVDEVIAFDDSDGTACDAIRKVKEKYPEADIIFANGGDRTAGNIPEYNAYKNDARVEFAFGVGGTKKLNSSSDLLNNWTTEVVNRPWGWYRVLSQGLGYKIKELEISPGKKLSMQRHMHRSEKWNIVNGSCTMLTEYMGSVESVSLTINSIPYTVEKTVWHQACNNTAKPCKIIEIQLGDICDEADIERKNS